MDYETAVHDCPRISGKGKAERMRVVRACGTCLVESTVLSKLFSNNA